VWKNKKSDDEAKKRQRIKIDEKVILVSRPEFETQWGPSPNPVISVNFLHLPSSFPWSLPFDGKR
jgi:hypothetical protein